MEYRPGGVVFHVHRSAAASSSDAKGHANTHTRTDNWTINPGDIVTFSYSHLTASGIPVNVHIHRIRHDIEWPEVIDNFRLNKSLNGMPLHSFFRQFSICDLTIHRDEHAGIQFSNTSCTRLLDFSRGGKHAFVL